MALKKQDVRRSGRKDKEKASSSSCYLSIIIPTQNDRDRLPSVLIEIDRQLEKSGLTYEILAVDAGRADDTSAMVERLIELIKNLRLVKLTIQDTKSKTAAFYSGAREAAGEWLLFLDIDRLPVLEELFLQLKEARDKKAGGSQVFLGVKPSVSSSENRAFKNLISNWPNMFLRAFSGVPMFIFLCLRKDITHRLLPLTKGQDEIFLAELVFLAKKLRCQVGETTTSVISQVDSRSDKLYFWRFLGQLIKIRLLHSSKYL